MSTFTIVAFGMATASITVLMCIAVWIAFSRIDDSLSRTQRSCERMLEDLKKWTAR